MNRWHGGYSITGGTRIVDGVLLSAGYAGIIYAYNVTTGELLWTHEVEDPYSEILWANNWPLYYLFDSDGKLYLGHTEHSVIDPKPRGAPGLVAIDLETGEGVFRSDGLFRQSVWGGRAIIGDSVIVTQDTYDQRMYAIGKGPSVITASANDDVTLGNKATIYGTVMDVSPGTKDPVIQMQFPNGVPAISDDDMSEWMCCVYKQFEYPDVTGVPVKLEAIDPNYNYQNLGTTTSDLYGNFGFSFEPEVPGLYMIIATFEGSDSYFGSSTTTYITVNPAPTPSTPIEPEQPTEPEEPETPTEPEEPETPTEPEEPETPTEPEEPTEPEQPAETPLITTEVAVLIAIAVATVIGVGAFWTLRKR
jgi:hypothetical protein